MSTIEKVILKLSHGSSFLIFKYNLIQNYYRKMCLPACVYVREMMPSIMRQETRQKNENDFVTVLFVTDISI